jgi:DNA-binding protein HU-beta
MNKDGIARELAKRQKITIGQASQALDLFCEIIGDQLAAGEKVTIAGFGTFTITHRAEREGVHPLDPSRRIKMPASKVPLFRAGEQLKRATK